MRIQLALSLALLFALAILSFSVGDARADCQLVSSDYGPKGSEKVRAEVVVSGLEIPWSIAFLPDGAMLVTERPGRLRLIKEGKLVEKPVLTLKVSTHGEGGLAGLALHPQFKKNRLFYLYYTARKGLKAENRIERFRLSDDDASATSDRVIFDGIDAAQYHDGGRLRFGPDGDLYVGTGDGRSPKRSQDLDSPNGKILRLTPDGKVPDDNPWPGKPAFVEGVRNCEGFDWLDPKTLVIADHGPSGELGRRGHDEIDVAHAGDNLGWPTIYSCETHPGMVTPLLTWTEAVPPGGAAFYTGGAIPGWKGSLLVGTLKSRHLHRVVIDRKDPTHVTRHEVYFEGDPPGGFGRLRAVVMGPDGNLYVTTSNCDGRGTCPPDKDRILRILPAR